MTDGLNFYLSGHKLLKLTYWLRIQISCTKHSRYMRHLIQFQRLNLLQIRLKFQRILSSIQYILKFDILPPQWNRHLTALKGEKKKKNSPYLDCLLYSTFLKVFSVVDLFDSKSFSNIVLTQLSLQFCETRQDIAEGQNVNRTKQCPQCVH